MAGPRRGTGLGLAGPFWKPILAWAPTSPSEFRSPANDDHTRIVVAFQVEPTEGGHAVLTGEVRLAIGGGKLAHRLSGASWLLGGPLADMLLGEALRLIKTEAEQRHTGETPLHVETTEKANLTVDELPNEVVDAVEPPADPHRTLHFEK